MNVPYSRAGISLSFIRELWLWVEEGGIMYLWSVLQPRYTVLFDPCPNVLGSLCFQFGLEHDYRRPWPMCESSGAEA